MSKKENGLDTESDDDDEANGDSSYRSKSNNYNGFRMEGGM